MVGLVGWSWPITSNWQAVSVELVRLSRLAKLVEVVGLNGLIEVVVEVSKRGDWSKKDTSLVRHNNMIYHDQLMTLARVA